MKKFLCVLLASFISTACTVAPKQAYLGNRLLPSNEATLSAKGKHSVVGFHDKILISKVNEMNMNDVGARLAGQMFPYPHLVYIKPGRHTVEFTFLSGLSHATSQVWFDAEAGETYYAAAEKKGYGVLMWIENEKGEKVGGIGSAPEE